MICPQWAPRLQTSLLLLLGLGLSLPQTQAADPHEAATLYFYDADYKELAVIAATAKKIKYFIGADWFAGIREVGWVRQVGEGCYKIFSEFNQGGASYQLREHDSFEGVYDMGNTVK